MTEEQTKIRIDKESRERERGNGCVCVSACVLTTFLASSVFIDTLKKQLVGTAICDLIYGLFKILANNFFNGCIFRPAFGSCALQMLVEMAILSIFCAKNLQKAKNLQQILAKNSFFNLHQNAGRLFYSPKNELFPLKTHFYQ